MKKKPISKAIPVARKHGRRYKWDEWFANGVFLLKQGVHYDCVTYNMAQMVRLNGKKRGYFPSIELHDDHMVVTATKLEDGNDSGN